MYRRNGFRTVLASLQLTAILLPAAMLAQTTIYPTPPGLGPGQTYQLLFVTADSITAVSTNIADYNAFATSEAALNPTLEAFDSTYGVTWTAIGSTATVNANVNAPSSGSVYTLDGVQIASSAQPLYSSTLLSPPDVDLYGVTGNYYPVWTGTVSGGAVDPGWPLGSAYPGFGAADFDNSQWLAYEYFQEPQANAWPVYALSSVITVPSPPTCDPPPTGTIAAWYGFDETASPSLNLATGNSIAWSGTLTPLTGEVGGALNFSAGYIDAPDSIIANFGAASDASKCGGGDFSTCQGDFSIDAWVNLSALPRGNVNAIADKRDATLIGYEFFLFGDPPFDNDHPWMGLQLGDAEHGYTNYGSAGLPLLTANAWHHVAVTVERLGSGGSDGVIKWYLDGKPAKAGGPSVPIQTGSLVNSVPLRIGAVGAANGGGSNFNGALDELQIFNRVLTSLEVQSIYNAQSSGECKP
jgi:hypothetical protein